MPDAERIEDQIVRACTASKLFRPVGTMASAAVPAVALPLSVVRAGVDKVCANPEAYAKRAGTVAWIIQNLRDR